MGSVGFPGLLTLPDLYGVTDGFRRFSRTFDLTRLVWSYGWVPSVFPDFRPYQTCMELRMGSVGFPDFDLTRLVWSNGWVPSVFPDF